MKKIFIFLITLLTISCYAQMNFEKGYYVNNSDQKIECLIKNVDWRNNPAYFEYKVSENSEVIKINITNAKEFGINNNLKFIRNTVKIDRSSESLNQLSKKRNPIFNEEQLFLKVLNEGKASLYQYKDVGLTRYFYKKENSNIEQLVFKKYKTYDVDLMVNNSFRQQLWKNLKCPTITLEKIENLSYKKTSLVNLFTTYNTCNNSNSVSYDKQQKKDLFNLTIRPRLNSSSLKFQNNVNKSLSVDFGGKLGFGFGIEAEFILPFNNNKWAIAIEPTYQSFTKTGKTTNPVSSNGTTLDVTIEYRSVEIPLSFRHYFFLNDKSKIFINASFVYDIPVKSLVEYRRTDTSSIFTTYDERDSQSNLAIGVGYKFNDQYGLEMRYQTNREVIGNFAGQNSNYQTISIIFGYTIF